MEIFWILRSQLNNEKEKKILGELVFNKIAKFRRSNDYHQSMETEINFFIET